MDIEMDKFMEASQDKLDIEYRQILRIIKPYIQTINNNTYLAHYRIWLEKLSDTKEDEKFVRNQYLMELARQIQCKHLAPPFNQNPPSGPLPPLRGSPWTFEDPIDESFEVPYEETEAYLNKQRMCQQWAEENEGMLATNRPQWPYHDSVPRPRKPSANQKLLIPEQQLKEAQKNIKRSATSVKKTNLLKEIDEQTEKLVEAGDFPKPPARPPARPARSATTPSPSTPKDFRTDQEKRRDQYFPSQNISLDVIHENTTLLNEEESWCDVSGSSNVSLAVLGSGDIDNKMRIKDLGEGSERFEKKINTLMIEINGLKKKSEKINERCENTLKNAQDQLSPKLTLIQSEDKKEMEEQKHSTDKEKSFINTDWKKIVESLQNRLSETQNQNRELNALTSTLRKKIKEMDSSKEKIKEEIRKQILEQQKKEMETIQSNHEKKTEELMALHEQQLKKIEDDFEKQRKDIEEKLERSMKEKEEKHVKEIREKEDEIRRLENIIQRECSRLINEITVLRSQIEEASHTNSSNDERILFLQKCITKMDRLFQKSEREYCKQIEKLKQELDNREKAIQIQLQTQKAEVVTRCSAEKQSELDLIVKNLETKYAQLLEMQQAQLSHMKSEDERIINNLKAVLDQHNVPY